MPSRNQKLAVLAFVIGAQAQSITTTAGPSLISATSALKLAKTYAGNSFFDGFNFETADDPTGGYVNYVSRQDAESGGLASVQSNGAVVMRANAELRASGRGRDSVRLSSKDEFADGVYILDVNHMPVGCGVWPAWWTVVKNGWPTGGEIDIIEGANTLPSRYGVAWNATGNITTPSAKSTRNVGSLHTNGNCQIQDNAYMTGATGTNTCSAFVNGNQGCGVVMGGNTTYGVESFGSQVNDVGGGWYAMWRDIEVSGGVYIYFWPRNSPNVPNDVRYSNATTTNVQGWGQPGANLTVPSCKGDFGNHVIVFNMAFCGDYTAATYLTSGCPTSTSCSAFVMNNPKAFAETYWSINSLRVYNSSGSSTSAKSGLSIGAIVGIAVGGAAFLIILGLLFWRYKVRKNRAVPLASPTEETEEPKTAEWAAADELPPLVGTYVAPLKPKRDSVQLATAKPRTGRTALAPGKTPRHHLDGETPAGFYHNQSLDNSPAASSVALNDRRASLIDKMSLAGSSAPPRKSSTFTAPRRESAYQGGGNGGSWVG